MFKKCIFKALVVEPPALPAVEEVYPVLSILPKEHLPTPAIVLCSVTEKRKPLGLHAGLQVYHQLVIEVCEVCRCEVGFWAGVGGVIMQE
eukprot:8067286-Pyramimonas_sp.AAC.1